MRLSPSIVLSLLALTAGGGALSHGIEWQPEFPNVAVSPAPLRPALAKVADTGGETGAYAESLRQRPPFTPGRRPYTPHVVVAAAEPEEMAVDSPLPTVHGVALAGQRSVAVVMETADSKTRRVMLGDEVLSWRVAAIRREGVLFESPSAEALVYLKKPGQEPRFEITPREETVARNDASRELAGREVAEKVDERLEAASGRHM